jgi:2-oxo-4-hydroxy-4-carboxy-5-ureidoimidazoline decarboxylase
MSEKTAIPLSDLNAMGVAQFVAALGDIYEHSPWVAEAVLARRPFASLADLHAAMNAAVTAADGARKLALLNAHPDLAGKAARAGDITQYSQAEQGSIGLDRLTDGEFENFTRINADYRRKFGFPFVICVRRHSKDSVLRQFEMRLGNSVAAEQDAALNEIFRIAALRLDSQVSAPDRLKVHGHLSTHVLDAYHGRPAPGVGLELLELSVSGEGRVIVSGATNGDGRTDRPLIDGRPLPIGRYELRFALGGYFARSGVVLPDPPFLDIVPVQFLIAEPEGHYHVPLLATPWSYSTYRGS